MNESGDIIRLGYEEIKVSLIKILLHHGFSEDRADLCATLFTETTLDGVYSHGLNRFPLFIKYINKRLVWPDAQPSLVQSLTNFEQWEGHLGPGNLNAWFCMDRAIKLAKESGTGMVAIRNTNHWMRGGSYGIQAANNNCIGMCMTNTKPNMPHVRSATASKHVCRIILIGAGTANAAAGRNVAAATGIGMGLRHIAMRR